MARRRRNGLSDRPIRGLVNAGIGEGRPLPIGRPIQMRLLHDPKCPSDSIGSDSALLFNRVCGGQGGLITSAEICIDVLHLPLQAAGRCILLIRCGAMGGHERYDRGDAD